MKEATTKSGKRANSRGRREEVVAAAAREFQERGYRATNIAMIGDRLGFTSAALYYYVGSKQELLVEIMTVPHRELVEIARSVSGSDLPPVEKLRNLILEHVRYMLRERDRFSIMLSERREVPEDVAREIEQLESEYSHCIQDLIQQAVDDGTFDVEHPGLAALGLVGAINWTNRWYRSDGDLSPDDIARIHFESFTRGAISRQSGR